MERSIEILTTYAPRLLELANALAINAEYIDLKNKINERLIDVFKVAYPRYFSPPQAVTSISKDLLLLSAADSGSFGVYTSLSDSIIVDQHGTFVDLLAEDGQSIRARTDSAYVLPIHDYDLIILAIGLGDQFVIKSFSGLQEPVMEDSRGPVFLLHVEVQAFDMTFHLLVSVYRENGILSLCETDDAGDSHITSTDVDDYEGFLIKSILEAIGHHESLKLLNIGLTDDQAKSMISILNF